jgi:HK97 family phage major capsid protein
MEIQRFLETKDVIPFADLAALAADRHAFGDDVAAAFKTQVQLRAREGQRILDEAQSGNRDLLASEQRSYEAAMRDIDAIIGLQRQAEKRTHERNFVPATQRHVSSQTTRGGIFGGEEFRALVGNTGAGSYIAPDEASSSFFDKLNAESVALQSGIRVITTERDALRVPRVLADPSVAWTSEGSQISPADPNYDEVVATPRKLAALVLVSNELVMDSNPSVLDMLEMQLARAIALKFDLGVFEGSGTPPEIRGLKNVSGINTAGACGGTGTGTGGATNLDHIASAITQLETDNARATAVVMHPRTWGQMLKLKEQTSGSNKPLLQDSAGSTATGVVRSVYGVPVFLSSQPSITETVSSSTDCSSIYVYQADQVVAVRRMDLRIEIDRSFKFDYDQTAIRAVMRIDLVCPNPKAIDRISGIRA